MDWVCKVWYGMHGLGMYGHRAGDVAADNEAPVMYHRILMSAQYDDQYIMIQRVVMVIKMIMIMLISIAVQLLQCNCSIT